MNFELIDNCFQVAVLLCAALAAIAAALRHKDRRFLILALFYICISMGTLYWVLCIFIMGNVPQVFYVSEFSWLAAYLFLLSFQMVREDSRSQPGLRIRSMPNWGRAASSASRSWSNQLES